MQLGTGNIQFSIRQQLWRSERFFAVRSNRHLFVLSKPMAMLRSLPGIQITWSVKKRRA